MSWLWHSPPLVAFAQSFPLADLNHWPLKTDSGLSGCDVLDPQTTRTSRPPF
jgi:hypothetical protein